jgi:hypothetical protein
VSDVAPSRKTLLAVIEFVDHGRLPVLYRQLGYETAVEWSVRKAVPLLRGLRPDVLVADFYFQPDFRDRLSNLESLLAAAEPLSETRVLLFYDPRDEHALERVRQRLRIDAALPVPVQQARLETLLRLWHEGASDQHEEIDRP